VHAYKGVDNQDNYIYGDAGLNLLDRSVGGSDILTGGNGTDFDEYDGYYDSWTNRIYGDAGLPRPGRQ
jgi:hypothetical protein